MRLLSGVRVEQLVRARAVGFLADVFEPGRIVPIKVLVGSLCSSFISFELTRGFRFEDGICRLRRNFELRVRAGERTQLLLRQLSAQLRFEITGNTRTVLTFLLQHTKLFLGGG